MCEIPFLLLELLVRLNFDHHITQPLSILRYNYAKMATVAV